MRMRTGRKKRAARGDANHAGEPSGGASAIARRERQTLIPTFDPEDLARELEASARPTEPPPFDPSSYARIVDAHVNLAAAHAAQADTPRTMTAVSTNPRSGASPAFGGSTTPKTEPPPSDSHVATLGPEDTETLGRAMYGSYLESDFPEALSLAERVLERMPEHALAQLVAERCRSLLAAAEPKRLSSSSVLRLRTPLTELRGLTIDPTSAFVLGQLDGVVDAGTVAELSGIPERDALERLHALLALGVVEVISC